MRKKGLLLILVLLLTFIISCTTKQKEQIVFQFKNGEAVETVYLDITDFEDNIYVADILEAEQFKDQLKAVMVDSDYGKYLTGIYGINADSSKNEFISLYTSLKTYAYDSTIVSVDSVNYYLSSVGVSSLPVVVGAYYLFALETY